MSWRFITCAALFVTCLVTANTIATKLIAVGGVVLTAGIVIFPLSYVLGDVLDPVVFVTLAFAGTVPTRTLGAIIVAQWAVKVAYEAAATPLTYAAVGYLKTSEHVDVYDHGTNFSPIRL